MAVTRFGKKMKKCSTNVWNKDIKKLKGCDYIEWISGKKKSWMKIARSAEKTGSLYHRLRQKNEKVLDQRLGQRQTRSHRLHLYPMA